MTVDPKAIRDQLERILASEAFATAGRHSRLLRYLVDRTLAGEGEQLKEYVLGTEVFDRADSYDPRLDSIVRVEARRLRRRLDDYYRSAGADSDVVISIPLGSYVPVFAERAAASHAVPTAAIADHRARSPIAAIAAALSVAIVVIAAGLAFNRERAPAQASTGPGIAVLPFEHYSTQERDALWAAQLTDAVTSELARLGTVSVASRTSAARYSIEGRAVGEIAKALDVTFLIEASAVANGNRLRVVARLVDARLDRKVWVGEYEADEHDVPTLARRIAAEAGAAALR